MAIKVGGIVVVDNSKNLSNIVNASLTGTLTVGSTPSTGTAGQVLTSNGSSAPSWQNISYPVYSSLKPIILANLFGK